MKLKNRFNKTDVYRVWGDVLWCHLCRSNEMTSVHHIDSTKSSSIYNSIPLCYSCHKIADSHNTQSPLSIKYRNKLRKIAYDQVTKSGHINNQEDENYNSIYKTNTR